MKQLYKSGAVAAAPPSSGAASDGNPTEGDVARNEAATVPGAYWFYQISKELEAVIEGADLVPDGDTLTQLRDAINAQIAAATPPSAWQPPIGTVVTLTYKPVQEPAGLAYADGRAVARAGTYAGYFALVGATYGAGDGATTFNLPDLRRRFIIGEGGGGGNGLASATGSTGGAETVSLAVGNLPAHTHGDGTYYAGSHSHSAGTLATDQEGDHKHAVHFSSSGPNTNPEFNYDAGPDTIDTINTDPAGAHSHDVTGSTGSKSAFVYGTSGSTGSNEAFAILPPAIALPRYVKIV